MKTFSNLQQGFRAAQKSNKPVLVHFYAQNCPMCASLDRNVLRNKEVISELSENWTVIRIDCTEETASCSEAADRYGVNAWPTWVFLDRNLKEVPSSRIIQWELKSAQVLKVLQKTRSR